MCIINILLVTTARSSHLVLCEMISPPATSKQRDKTETYRSIGFIHSLYFSGTRLNSARVLTLHTPFSSVCTQIHALYTFTQCAHATHIIYAVSGSEKKGLATARCGGGLLHLNLNFWSHADRLTPSIRADEPHTRKPTRAHKCSVFVWVAVSCRVCARLANSVYNSLFLIIVIVFNWVTVRFTSRSCGFNFERYLYWPDANLSGISL